MKPVSWQNTKGTSIRNVGRGEEVIFHCIEFTTIYGNLVEFPMYLGANGAHESHGYICQRGSQTSGNVLQ